MLRIKTPATSANIGPGFDCFGIAWNIYNTFDVELSDVNILENVEERFNNEDNLFLQAYRRGCQAIGIEDHIRARFSCDIPVSRGMGSSAAMITGGLTAASILHDDALSEAEIFQLASEMEGHPDNAAPCVAGGMTASSVLEDGRYFTRPIQLADKWKFTLLIPDYEVSTEAARSILPASYPRSVAAGNISRAVLTAEALRSGDTGLLKMAARDAIHEPYRKTLIPGFEEIQKITEQDTGGVFLISGSGSACLLIADYELTPSAKRKIAEVQGNWEVTEVQPAVNGTQIRGDI